MADVDAAAQGVDGAPPQPSPSPPSCAKATPAPWKKPASAASAPSSFAQLQENDKQAAAVLKKQLELAAEAEAKAELAARERELLQPNATLVKGLTDMGFGANISARACLATGNSTVDAACGWVLENLDNPEANAPLDEWQWVSEEPAPPSPSEPEPPVEDADDSVDGEGWVDIASVAVVDADDTTPQLTAEEEAAKARAKQEAQDAALAKALAGGAHIDGVTGTGALADSSCGSDAALAAAIQRQIEEENDREVRHREKLENKRLGLSGNSKLSVSHANHYTHAQESQWRAGAMVGNAPAEPQSPSAEAALEFQELVALGFTLDEKSGQWRDAEGQLVTKHNRLLSGRQNTKRLAGMDGLAGDFGDLEGDGISLPTPAYNRFRKELAGLEDRQAVRGSGNSDGKKRFPKEGKEYGIEHGGAGEYAGVRIISEGAA